ncbi:M28 family metallopeptidase [Salegentibacter salarius]|uniref:Peptidase M28 n=1 Tax=Salegentibacter salarius TaxID=435906 RepID=A0A2N0TVX4_9FLAO|nr:M28 family metallopeptidase [Salegentibacter salarius]OEY72618.1 peptidase M28 [Salegentibacter salarius]PKD18915.1 peptidase M28 [Salegentibacter salarius]SLK01529.1 Peptidase family M28 [Salegentibacter salarius]
MKKMLLVALSAGMVACGTQKNVENANPMEYAETITASELKEHLYTFASDEFEGRNTGEPGQKKAAEYIVNEYQEIGIEAPQGYSNYYQEIPTEFFDGKLKDSENVLGFIKGSEKPDEILVITSHYDHVGVDDEGNIYNGADDGGSGPVGILEIAEAFKAAQKDGYTPKRSILFIHLTGEEKGLLGSKYYVENPVFPLENTVANLNMDMIGRIDKEHEGNDNYVYLIGSDKLSTDLHELSENVNSEYMNMDLDYTYNDENDPNRFYYRSDHYNFAKNNIPVIFYFNGVHPDYHKPTDTVEKIEYEALMKRARLVFLTAWEIANRDERLVVDKAGE